ncbi:Asp23/Gls24 family envelope stress response protein [Candidatus Hydrogenedentota bacterium]
MAGETDLQLGEVEVSNEVIASIARHETLNISGVVGLGGGGGRTFVERVSGTGQTLPGIRIHVSEDDKLTIDLSIVVQYNIVIPDLAREVQEAVLTGLHKMTRAGIAQINVHVDGVVLPEESKGEVGANSVEDNEK